MKSRKIFLVLAAVLVFFFAAVFTAGAQELKFDGYINSGLGIRADDSDGTDPELMIYGVDSESNIGRFRLNGAYTNAGGNAGANFRFQVQRSGTTRVDSAGNDVSLWGNLPSLPFAYGWVKPLDMLTIKFGLVDDTTWATADFFYNEDQGEGAGVLARLSPIPGLDLGAGAYLAGTTDSSSNNFYPVFPSGIVLADAKYTFNASYTMDKTFRLAASFRPENAAGGRDSSTSQLLAELRILAVDGLTAVVVGRFNNLTDDDANKDMIFYETIGFKTGDLNLGLNAAQFIRTLPSGSTSKDDPAMLFNLWGSYALAEGKLVPRLDINFITGGTLGGSNYHRRAYAASYDSDRSALNVRPSLKINLDSRNSLEIGDSLYYDLTTDAAPALVNVFYLDFVVRF